jgi:hypothetical protein
VGGLADGWVHAKLVLWTAYTNQKFENFSIQIEQDFGPAKKGKE